jgi:RHS repeat-associated protein
MDKLAYNYKTGTNQLDYVYDTVPAGNYDADIDAQSAGNYTYDEIGNLVKDNAEHITSISWTVYGKISHIAKDDGTNTFYTYDAGGNRISKLVIPPPTGGGQRVTTWYVRDATGNVMSVYESGKPALNDGHLTQSELHLYGSSRLGLLHRSLDVAVEYHPSETDMQLLGSGLSVIFDRGNKLFELSNHLGNVLVTLNDKKLGVSSNNSTVDYFNPQVVSAQDYYPFGMLQPGRSMNAGGYRYGFNGKENYNEVKGEGNPQDYGMRVYDPRVGRFLSVDPLTKTYPYYTPYQFSSNMPIAAIDRDGLEAKVSFSYGVIGKDRTWMRFSSSVNIKVQIINLSAISDGDLNLQAIQQNLSADLSDKLGGSATVNMKIPYVFKSTGNYITSVTEASKAEEIKEYSITYDTYVTADVSIVNDISKIPRDAFVFAIVDDVKNESGMDTQGQADAQKSGKVAIGEVGNFEGTKVNKEGRQLVLHELLHLFGAVDTYKDNSTNTNFPGTSNKNNVMYFLDPDN